MKMKRGCGVASTRRMFSARPGRAYAKANLGQPREDGSGGVDGHTIR